VLSVDESREQTQAIHRLQRERRTLHGLVNGERKQRLLAQHRHAQRLLRPLKVLEPVRRSLTFLSDKTRTRRDHEKYLTLIDTIALLHQYQRDLADRTDRTARRSSTSRRRGRISRRRMRSRTKSWAGASMSCRRRPGGCSRG
jgi:hypothetical protein